MFFFKLLSMSLILMCPTLDPEMFCTNFFPQKFPFVYLEINSDPFEVITDPSSFYLFYKGVLRHVLSFFMGMWTASFQACGTVAHSHPALWMYKQTERCAQMGTKGRLMGEARRSQVDQGAMWERWNLPSILLGPPKRKRNVRFTGFSVLLGNMEALTHTREFKSFSHTRRLGKNGKAVRSQMLLCVLQFLRKQADEFHTHTDTDTHTHTHTHTHSGIFKLVQRDI